MHEFINSTGPTQLQKHNDPLKFSDDATYLSSCHETGGENSAKTRQRQSSIKASVADKVQKDKHKES